jgi:thiamine pyrophosphokinase
MCRPILLKSSFLRGKPFASVALTLKNLNIFELVLCLQGVKIIDESHDQDTTDLHKCVIFIRDYVPDLDKNHIKLLVLGGLGGRFDHEAANINVLYTFATVLRIVLLSEESSLTLLPSGYLHEIHVNRSFEGPHCGLVPLGAPSTSTTTTGLHWNLDDTPMAFGSLISTCNLLESDIVTVRSDAYLLWTTEIRYEP